MFGYSLPLRLGSTILDARKTRAYGERIRADAGDALGDCDAREAAATGERIRADGSETIGEGNGGKARAAAECGITDAGNPLGNGYVGNFITIPESVRRNLDHTCGNYHMARDFFSIQEQVVCIIQRIA